MTYGVTTSDVELIIYPGGGSHKVIKNFESPHDFEVFKTAKYGKYHVASLDRTCFAEIDIPDPSWPGNSWQVNEILAVIHKSSLLSFVDGLAEQSSIPVEPTLTTDLSFLYSLSAEITFYSMFGRASPSKLFGTLRTPLLSQISINKKQQRIELSTSQSIIPNWQSSDFDSSLINLPPSDGFFSVSIFDSQNDLKATFMGYYNSEITQSSSESNQQQTITQQNINGKHIIRSLPVFVEIPNGSQKDFGMRDRFFVDIYTSVRSEQSTNSKEIEKVEVGGFRLVAAVNDVNKWFGVNVQIDQLLHYVNRRQINVQ